MSLANYLAKIQHSGIYRFTFDKSEIGGTDAQTLRLVVGYSEKGPFNTPMLVEKAADFIKIYGNINKKLERRGVWFHRLALQALEAGPILALNLKKFSNEEVGGVSFNGLSTMKEIKAGVEDIYDISRFWTLSPEKLPNILETNLDGSKDFISIVATDSLDASNTIFVRGYSPNGYDVTLKTYYKTVLNEDDLPVWAEPYANTLVSDYFMQIYVFRGKFTPALAKSAALHQYFDVVDDQVFVKPFIKNAFGDNVDTLDALAADENSNFLRSYVGTTIPDLMNNNGSPLSIDLQFNQDNSLHKMMMHLDSNALYMEDITLDKLQTTGFNEIVKVVSSPDGDEYSINQGLSAMSNNAINPIVVEGTFDGSKWKFQQVGAEEGKYEYLNEPNLYKYNFSSIETLGNAIELSDADCNAVKALSLQVGERFAGPEGVATLTSIEFANMDNTDDSSEDSSEGIIDSLSDTSSGIEISSRSVTITFDKPVFIESNEDAEGNTSVAIYKLNYSLTVTPCDMQGSYILGYEYAHSKPANSSDLEKYNWITEHILGALKYYTGLRNALTDRNAIDYRYIVDTFESFVASEIKKELTLIAKEKDNAMALCNLPSAQTLINCKYASFTDKLEGSEKEGPLNVKYIKSGANRQRPYSRLLSLPTEINGASYASFNTPLKFIDGYQKIDVPSAALVSNLFIAKYQGRQPYYPVAGPNYSRIQAEGLIGPDYSYSSADLDILEPLGWNVMVYQPKQGTFINSNQTAKQNPVTALSKINVRELVIYLQDEIEKVLQDSQWEMNTQTLRDMVKAKADYICEHVKNNHGIYDYINVCDESNNTDEVIDNEMLVIDTSIEPARGAGKMVQTLTVYKKGGLSALIS